MTGERNTIRSASLAAIPRKPAAAGTTVRDACNRSTAAPLVYRELTSPARPARRGAVSQLDVYRTTLSALAGLIETRDPDAGDHLGRIQSLCRCVTDEMRNDSTYRSALSGRFADLIVEASMLHDIGKAAVPDNVLLKRGRLTEREFDQMRQHTTAGYRALCNITRRIGPHPFLSVAAQIAHCHHERWDGGGYPRRLSGRRIPLAARIVAVADVFDALVSRRCYKDAIPIHDARAMIKAGAARHFDPAVVAAFDRAADRITPTEMR